MSALGSEADVDGLVDMVCEGVVEGGESFWGRNPKNRAENAGYMMYVVPRPM